MTDRFDRRSTNRTRAQFEAARTAGGWMPWVAAMLAFGGWAGLGAWLYVTVGVDALLATPPLMLAAGAAAALVPGLCLIVAGVMARESRRSTEANALVLTAARLLLEPADKTREDISSMAEAVAKETQFVNKALAETRARMDGLRSDIEASVTHALKAAEIVRTDSEVLVGKIAAERSSLSQLSDTLKAQAESLARSIPRHAETMANAARQAQDEVRKADETLDARLRSVESATRNLAEKIGQLDTMGAESRKRAQTMATALHQLEEQLTRSTRMVDAAVKAGELAATASKGTADALRDAMSDALGSAMKTSETIAAQSAAASEGARQAMDRLKEAGLQAEATTRSATLAARAQADETEQRINQLSEFLFRAAGRAGAVAETGLDRARERIQKASSLINQMREDDSEPSSIDDLLLEPEPRPGQPPLPRQPEVLRPAPRASGMEFESALRQAGAPDDILDAHRALPPRSPLPPLTQPAFAPVQPPAPAPQPQVVSRPPPAETVHPNFAQPSYAPQSYSSYASHAPQPPAPPPAPRAAEPPVVGERVATWRDLLTGIEEAPAHERDEKAMAMMDRLDRAGVKLKQAVRAGDLRRIAQASHQGERQRRRAIRDAAPSDIQRVARLLDQDRDLQRDAKAFVAYEEPTALRVLGSAERAREDAAPRLSAYLLLDAALGVML
jgi:hypothetical protein